jgi:hypothetical protein
MQRRTAAASSASSRPRFAQEIQESSRPNVQTMAAHMTGRVRPTHTTNSLATSEVCVDVVLAPIGRQQQLDRIPALPLVRSGQNRRRSHLVPSPSFRSCCVGA